MSARCRYIYHYQRDDDYKVMSADIYLNNLELVTKANICMLTAISLYMVYSKS